jgi:hypothetical protein
MRATAVVRWRDLRSARAFPRLQILYPASSAWLQLQFVLLPLLGPGLLWRGVKPALHRAQDYHHSLGLRCLGFRLRELDFIPCCDIQLDLDAETGDMGWELLNSKGGAKRCQMGAHGVESKGERDRGTTVHGFLDFWASEAEIK